MIEPNSLSDFFHRTDATTLDNCDQEQIHLSGQIQNLGALLVVDPETRKILAASENAAGFFNLTMDRLMRSGLSDLDEDLDEQVGAVADDTQILHDVLEFALKHDGVHFDAVTHCFAGRRIIEFVPNSDPSATSLRRKMRLCSAACTRIIHAAHFDQSLQIAVDAIRKITGCSRIKIYRFQPDWAGEVVAESTDGVLPSYLGLCFPAGDIPKQVREIMAIVPYRAIGTADDDPVPIRAAPVEADRLDLTLSVLRSVSNMHTQYLRNIDVGSAFSCSLMHQDRLWGLIAAHDKEPGLLAFDSWSLLQEIGSALMLRFSQQQRTDVADTISRLRLIENQFATTLRQNGNMGDVIAKLMPVLQKFLSADGFAFQFGNTLHVSGRTPPPDFISDLIKWAVKNCDASDQFETLALHKQWPAAIDHMETACGVLIQPTVAHRICQLIWFRGPITRTVHWAGRPPEKTATDKGEKLGPRKSFDRWKQQHNDQSAPWKDTDLESTREIFTEFLDIMAAQMLLKEENTSLRQFAATAAHDLKGPLRRIETALDWMSEDGFEPNSVKQTHALAKQSSRRLSELAEDLLKLSALEGETIATDIIDIGDIVSDVRDLLSVQFDETGARLHYTDLPGIVGSRPLILRLFLNIISNSLKYRSPDRVPDIHVSATIARPGIAEIAIADNGMGIAPKYAERIFKPLERLHSGDQIEGTGLGLTICARILDKHNGSIILDRGYDKGARFVITLPVHGAGAA